MKSTHVQFSELELERELEDALGVQSAIGSGVDQASRAGERAHEAIRVVEIDVVEEVYRLDVELSFEALGELELLEERRVGSPITGAAQRVALLVAKSSGRGGLAEDAQVLNEPDDLNPIFITVAERTSIDVVFYIMAASPIVVDIVC